MGKTVKKEIELYSPMVIWLQTYLEDKYKVPVITEDSHAQNLDVFLEKHQIIDYYPETIGLDIQIDVLGIVKTKAMPRIVFIEAKKGPLNLHDLGQLWAYCKLCDPAEAFLLSPAGLGSLNKIFNNLTRTDILNYGDNKNLKMMQVAEWDVIKGSIKFDTLVPKI